MKGRLIAALALLAFPGTAVAQPAQWRVQAAGSVAVALPHVLVVLADSGYTITSSDASGLVEAGRSKSVLNASLGWRDKMKAAALNTIRVRALVTPSASDSVTVRLSGEGSKWSGEGSAERREWFVIAAKDPDSQQLGWLCAAIAGAVQGTCVAP